jgi:hypothetical protein
VNITSSRCIATPLFIPTPIPIDLCNHWASDSFPNVEHPNSVLYPPTRKVSFDFDILIPQITAAELEVFHIDEILIIVDIYV